MALPWGPWRPDVLGPNSGVCAEATGVVPIRIGSSSSGGAVIGYAPANALTVAPGASALSAAPLGSISLTLHGGSNEIYYATSTTIQKQSATYGWTSIETGRTVTSGDDVSFCHFGSFLLNSDTTDGFKAYNVETPAGNNAVSGAPAARFIFSAGNCVFALDCDGNNKKMQSTAIGDHTNWTTQGAEGKTFEDGGALIAGHDLGNGQALVLQRDAIRFIQFGGAGDLALYSIVKVADGRGSVGYRSVADFDGKVFFLDHDGFYMFDAANGVRNIGAEHINAWFFSQVDTSRLDEVQATVDPERTLVLWRFYTSGNASTSVSDRILGYHYTLGCWFLWEVECSWITDLKTAGYTLEDMDALGTLDEILIPLDDRFFMGGEGVLAGLDGSYKPAIFSGSNMAATIVSAPQSSDVRTMINEVTQLSDDTSRALSIGVREQLSASESWNGPYSASSRTGRTMTRASGRVLTFKSTHAAGNTWTYDNGVDYPKQAGMGV